MDLLFSFPVGSQESRVTSHQSILYISRERREVLAGGDEVSSSLTVNGIFVTKSNAEKLDHFGNITTLGGSESITEKLSKNITSSGTIVHSILHGNTVSSTCIKISFVLCDKVFEASIESLDVDFIFGFINTRIFISKR